MIYWFLCFCTFHIHWVYCLGRWFSCSRQSWKKNDEHKMKMTLGSTAQAIRTSSQLKAYIKTMPARKKDTTDSQTDTSMILQKWFIIFELPQFISRSRASTLNCGPVWDGPIDTTRFMRIFRGQCAEAQLLCIKANGDRAQRRGNETTVRFTESYEDDAAPPQTSATKMVKESIFLFNIFTARYEGLWWWCNNAFERRAYFCMYEILTWSFDNLGL